MRSGSSLTVIVGLAALAALFGRDATFGSWSPASAPRLLERCVDCPSALGLRFERNVGQSDPSVRFIARYGRATALLKDDAIVFLPASPRARRSPAERHAIVHGWSSPSASPDVALSPSPTVLRFRGASAGTSLAGEAPLAAAFTSFKGPEPDGRALPSFARVRARGVYPGIDVVFHAGPRGIELDFEVAPGADPSVIALASEREDDAPVARADGSIVFGRDDARSRALVLSAPRTYEVGARGEMVVASAWNAAGDARFTLGARSTGLPLVIDPVIDMATYIGGSGADVTGIEGIALDGAGNIYVSGTTTSPDLPVTAGAPGTALLGTDDVFVAKLSADFKTLAYCTYLGGSDTETYAYLERPIAVDASGALYVTGETASTDFPTTPGAYDRTANGGYDMFVTKLAADGKSLVFSTYLGSSGDDHGFGLAVDGGSAFVAGYMKGSDFPITPGSIPTTSTGVVTKLAPNGGSLVYSTYVGGATTAIFDLAVHDGFAYAIGDTQVGSFPATAGAYQTVYGGGSYDALVMKLKTNGSGYVYATYLGGDALDEAFGIDIDAAGDAIVVGGTISTNFPHTANAFVDTAGGDYDGYVAKLDASGTKLLYGSYFAGPNHDLSTGVCVDTLGNAFIAGTTSGGLKTKGSCTTTGYGFVQMLEPTGNVRFSSLMPEQVYGIACGASRVVGFMAVAAETGLAPPTAYDPTFNGGTDELVFGLRPGPSGLGCLPCDGAFGAGTPRPCPDAATPLCNTSGPLLGSCTYCTPADLTRCMPGQICSTVTGECTEPVEAGTDGGPADAAIPDGATAADAGTGDETGVGGEVGAAPDPGDDGGCGCRVVGYHAKADRPAWSVYGLLVIALGTLVRRRSITRPSGWPRATAACGGGPRRDRSSASTRGGASPSKSCTAAS